MTYMLTLPWLPFLSVTLLVPILTSLRLGVPATILVETLLVSCDNLTYCTCMSVRPPDFSLGTPTPINTPQ